MIHPFILHNGEIKSATEKLLCPGQVGLLAGWGVFTTIRVYDGVPFAFEHHWARITKDARLVHVPCPAGMRDVQAGLRALVRANRAENATLRLLIVRNRGGLWEGPGNKCDYDWIAVTANPNPWPAAVKLGLKAQGRHAACEFAGAKILSWAQNLTWYEEAHARGFDEVVLLNERGEVSECTSANIFIADGNQVWTPPLSSGCLPGVTRELLLGEVAAPGITIGEKTLFPADLEQADEVFITSTTRHLLPVVSIEGLQVRSAGPACALLQAAFAAYVKSYVAGH